MCNLSKQPDALGLVDQLHPHKLDYRHINHFQVHHSDHHAMYTAACCSIWGAADAQELLVFHTAAEKVTCIINVSHSH